MCSLCCRLLFHQHRAVPGVLVPGPGVVGGPHGGLSGQCPVASTRPTTRMAAGGSGAAPAPGMEHLAGDRLRLGQPVNSQLAVASGQARQGRDDGVRAVAQVGPGAALATASPWATWKPLPTITSRTGQHSLLCPWLAPGPGSQTCRGGDVLRPLQPLSITIFLPLVR